MKHILCILLLALPLGLQAMEYHENKVEAFNFDDLPRDLQLMIMDYPTAKFLRYINNLSLDQLLTIYEKSEKAKEIKDLPRYARTNKKLHGMALELMVKSLGKETIHQIIKKQFLPKIEEFLIEKGFTITNGYHKPDANSIFPLPYYRTLKYGHGDKSNWTQYKYAEIPPDLFIENIAFILRGLIMFYQENPDQQILRTIQYLLKNIGLDSTNRFFIRYLSVDWPPELKKAFGFISD